MKGWTCPSCGRGVAPDVKTCDHGGVLDAKGRDFLPPFPPHIDAPAERVRRARDRATAIIID